MKYVHKSIPLLLAFFGITTAVGQEIRETEWLVIGAGVAGICATTRLLDNGIDASHITLVDDKFIGGRLTEYYQAVPGNTKTEAFIDFLTQSPLFKETVADDIAYLEQQDPQGYEELRVITRPLQKITHLLQQKVNTFTGSITTLDRRDGWWYAHSDTLLFKAHKVILAQGAYPRSLAYTTSAQEISLDIAIDRHKLKNLVNADDTVIVVGGAHSAILVLKFLSELAQPVKKIINLYLKPLTYSIPMGSWTLNAYNGLKGLTAAWAQSVLEKNPPKNLIRMHNSPENREQALSQATKIIYAAGYERTSLPRINGKTHHMYNDITGEIDENLYGIGLAYPELAIDPQGNKEHRVGVNSFMDFATRMVPLWIQSKGYYTTSGIEILFEDLELIDTL